MEVILFVAFLGFAIYIYTVFRKRLKYQSNKKEIDTVAVQLISGNQAINYTNDDRIQYFGSLSNDEESYHSFKSNLPFTDKMLIRYFRDNEYDSSGDNLLIYRILKSGTHQTFIIAINDPSDMDQDFSIHEILGPFES